MKRAAVLALLGLALVGCSGNSKGADKPLTWQDSPRLIKTPRHDRVLIGRVTNVSGERLVVEAKNVKLIDSDSRRVRASVAFISSFVKSNFPHNNGPMRIPEAEQVRLGQLAEIDPGASSPLTVAWHEPPGPASAVRIDYGRGALPVPAVP
jgi:hypothetical protein